MDLRPRVHARSVAVVLGVALALHASPASAEWRLGVEALTDVPVQFGGRVWVEFPYGVRVDTSLGWLPGPYVDVINAIVVGLEGYDQNTADLVAGALSSSLVWRLHAGWRPLPDWGFYFEAGYGLAALGGGLGAEQLITAATGRAPPHDVPADRTYDITSLVHMIDVEVGWQWALFDDRLTLRTAIGFAGTVGASTTIEPQFTPLTADGRRGVEQLTEAGEAYLDDVYTSYVFTPVVTAAVGYQFL
ncbi:MAG: hypothetical protein HY907_20130 [Deltaproteobacteria bacterium]|nr:hypothetical protein [Deltaproteobacteria bacterium]